MKNPRKLPAAVLDEQLSRLVERTLEIQGWAEWATDPRGNEFVQVLTDEVARLQMQLPDATLEDAVTARAFAAMIKSYANVLRIFNSPVLEYERVRELVDKRLSSIGDDNA